jgi:hypothetical protein
MEWIVENATGLLLVLTGTISLAATITALTPTPKDDAVVAKLRKLLNALALNVGNSKSE